MTRPPHRHRLDSHLARFALYCVLALYIVAMVWGASRLELSSEPATEVAPAMEPVGYQMRLPMGRGWDCFHRNPKILEGPYRHGPGFQWLVDVQRRDGEYTLICPPVSWLPR